MSFQKTVIAAALAVAAFSGAAQANDARLYRAMERYDNVRERAEEVMARYPGVMSGYEADMEGRHLIYTFDVIQYPKKRVVEVEVNAASGRMSRPEYERIGRDLPTAAEAAGMISLVNALDIVEGEFGPYAVDASLDLEGSRLNERFVFSTEVLKPNYEIKADVDANTGDILAPGWDRDPHEQLEDWFDDDRDDDDDDRYDDDRDDDDRDDRDDDRDNWRKNRR